MVYSWGDHFGQRTAWSLLYFFNYGYYDIHPSLKFIPSPFINLRVAKANFLQTRPPKWRLHQWHATAATAFYTAKSRQGLKALGVLPVVAALNLYRLAMMVVLYEKHYYQRVFWHNLNNELLSLFSKIELNRRLS